MTVREDLPKAFKHNTSISANKTIACHDRCISCVGLDSEESVGHVGAEGVADQRDRLRGCWQQSILVGAKGRDELGEDRDLDVYLVEPARDSVLGLVISWGWDARKGNILVRDTDTKTIVEEDGVSFVNSVLNKVVLIRLVSRVPIASSYQRYLAHVPAA